MRPTRIDVREETRDRLNRILNEELAEAIDLRYHAKQAHWNVRAPAFYALHKLFEKVTREVDEHIDLLGERVVQLGGFAEGTVQVASRRSGLPSYPLDISSPDDHVDALADSMSSYASGLREALSVCTTLGDEATNDILIQLLRETEKLMWMVDASLLTPSTLQEHPKGPREARRQQSEVKM